LRQRAYVRRTGRKIEDGHGYSGLHIELTWYGIIRIHAVDLSEAGADFHRHMMGAPREEGWGVLRAAAGRFTQRTDQMSADTRAGGYPSLEDAASSPVCIVQTWIPACAGIYGTKLPSSHKAGTDPPLVPAPLRAGRAVGLSALSHP
ncbi:MAG: hypothetical protein AAFY10_05790, partial [Pseudomonadota bacterium]